jgi:hypothetical protein
MESSGDRQAGAELFPASAGAIKLDRQTAFAEHPTGALPDAPASKKNARDSRVDVNSWKDMT